MVYPVAEYSMLQYVLREFRVTDSRDGQSRTVRQFQYTEWPEQGVPSLADPFIDFIGQVHKTKEQFGQDGPITVHCSTGVGRTGVFIGLSIILERLQYENAVDVFTTVKLMRAQRMQMVQTEVSVVRATIFKKKIAFSQIGLPLMFCYRNSINFSTPPFSTTSALLKAMWRSDEGLVSG